MNATGGPGAVPASLVNAAPLPRIPSSEARGGSHASPGDAADEPGRDAFDGILPAPVAARPGSLIRGEEAADPVPALPTGVERLAGSPDAVQTAVEEVNLSAATVGAARVEVGPGGLLALLDDSLPVAVSAPSHPSVGEARGTVGHGSMAPVRLVGGETHLEVTPDIGQVQISLAGRPFFAAAADLGFLGPEAARTIGDGARWRHPFPQDWGWPPREPAGLRIETHGQVVSASVDDPAFVACYGVRSSLGVRLDPTGDAWMASGMENVVGAPKSAWIVAPFAMPAGHTIDQPAAMAVFPVSRAEELAPLHLAPGSEATRTWDYDGDRGLMFVSPGARLEAGQDKALLTNRWSLFGRQGDTSVMVLRAPEAAGPDAFQVYAGIGAYLELEWAGEAVAPGETSRVEVHFEPVALADLGVQVDGRPLLRLGESGAGLKRELSAVTEALQARPDGPGLAEGAAPLSR